NTEPLSSSKNQLRENIFSLFVLQGSNYLLPIITVPYLVRILGPEKFGLIAFAQAFKQYFILLTDYGFNLSATRNIALSRDDPQKVAEIFNSVMIIKLGFMLLSFLLISLIIQTIPKFKTDWQVYLVTFVTVIGNVLFPVWLFQGLERMKHITVLNITSKVLATIAIFIFIRSKEDYILSAFIQASGPLMSGLLGLGALLKMISFQWRLPTVEELKTTLVDGWHLFISIAAISLYTTSNMLVLGLVTNNATVGYFSAADKIIKAAQGLLSPISQAFFPYINAWPSRSKEIAVSFIKKSLK